MCSIGKREGMKSAQVNEKNKTKKSKSENHFNSGRCTNAYQATALVEKKTHAGKGRSPAEFIERDTSPVITTVPQKHVGGGGDTLRHRV